ncbi:MAG TPA: cytochrome c [Candidatus Acidoferrum sp.]|nr:cytochrome c [Candidatus Acidoferrum sp.]
MSENNNPSNIFRLAVIFFFVVILAALVVVRTSEARISRGQKQSSGASTGNPQNGKLVFENMGCNKCHGSEGEGVSGSGQNTGVPRIASTSLTLPAFLELVRKPKGQMPPFGIQRVSDAELTDVYALLQTLKPVTARETSIPANMKNGERLFVSYGCYECHGYLGQGSSRTGGSRLGPPQIPLSAFVSYVREPTGQMPPYTAKAASNEELAEIYDFLKSIPPPPPLKTIPLLNQ